MPTDFKSSLLAHWEADDLSSDEKKFKKWYDKAPNGPMRKRAMKQMEAHSDAIIDQDNAHRSEMFGGKTYSSFEAVDWQKLFEMLAPLIKLIISLFTGA